ncbi:MAG TPA: cytochrome c oxidase assembly protein [Gemmatimonadaceae bacterium]|nr:cytochrome c oxidase assembly protein [Gemmatimonadaceae bacterium]
MTTRLPFALRVLALVGTVPDIAYAHPGGVLAPHDLWQAWTIAPAVLVGCLVAALAYARGEQVRRARTRVARPAARWRTWSFIGAIAAILVALVSPVDALGGALFSAHMVQHLLLMMVAAPLMVLGDPMTAFLWALPPTARRAVGRWWLRQRMLRRSWRVFALPIVAWTLHVVTLWVWHLPSLYDRAVADGPLHVLEHATFFLTALLFWWVPFRPHGRRLDAGPALLYLFAAALQSTILGAVLALARHPLYVAHLGTTRPWGLTPLEDQQLAGLWMWVPAGLVYLVALVPLALRVLRVRGSGVVIARYEVAG